MRPTLMALLLATPASAAQIAPPTAAGPNAKYVTCYQDHAMSIRSGIRRDDSAECKAVFKEIDDAQAAERRRISD